MDVEPNGTRSNATRQNADETENDERVRHHVSWLSWIAYAGCPPHRPSECLGKMLTRVIIPETWSTMPCE
ncbi:MAG: hypothetical protein KC776_07115 [Myxococcales bacterium]|nr:hypothetical protein [Myxococcales bacterium]MCB9578468.1 hypothetical protein [Polyangiaceae bacterium]